MSVALFLTVCGFFASFMLAMAMGANDVANAFGTSVGSGVLTMRQAIVLAGMANFLGATSMSGEVTDTIRKGIVDLAEFEGDGRHRRLSLMLVMLTAMMGAVTYIGLATKVAMPVSSTQAILGGLVGAVIAKDKSRSGVRWRDSPMCSFDGESGSFSCGGVIGIVLQWIIAPVLSFIFSLIVFSISYKLLLNVKPEIALRRAPAVMAFYLGAVAFLLAWFIIVEQQHHPNSNGWKPQGEETDVATELQVLVCVMIGIGLAYVSLTLFTIDPSLLIYQPYLRYLQKERANNENSEDQGSVELRTISGGAPTAAESVVDLGVTEDIDFEDVDSPKPSFFERIRGHTFNPLLLSSQQREKVDEEKTTDEEVFKNKEKDGVVEYDPRVESVFGSAQIATATLAAFAAGANDVANEVAPLAAIYQTYRQGEVTENAQTPIWLFVFAGIGIVTGLSLFGHRVMKTIGHDTTVVTPARGFNVEMAYSVASLVASAEGWPVSTTQLAVGALCGVGLASGTKENSLNFKLLRRIFLAWTLTPALSSLFAGLYFIILKPMIKN